MEGCTVEAGVELVDSIQLLEMHTIYRHQKQELDAEIRDEDCFESLCSASWRS